MIHERQAGRTRRRTLTAAAAACAMAVGGLALPAQTERAEAADAPVFSELSLEHRSAFEEYTGPCELREPVESLPEDRAIQENDAPASSSSSFERTVASRADAVDTNTAKVTLNGTATATSTGTRPRSLKLVTTGTAGTTTSLPVSACGINPYVSMKLNYKFTIAEPMWATLSYTKRPSDGEVSIWAWTGNFYERLDGRFAYATGRSAVRLEPGTYAGVLESVSVLARASTTTQSLATSAVLEIAFSSEEPAPGGQGGTPAAPPKGTAISRPNGAAQRYAALASARSCSTHTLPARLTTSRSRITRISKVTFSVNGRIVKTLQGRQIRRGLGVRLPIADGATASVKTTVKLKKFRSHGKLRAGTVSTARATYRACA